MPRSSRRAAPARVFLVLALVCLHSAAEAAAPEESVTALVDRGLSLRRARNDAAALAAFEQAYQAQPSPMILAQIALAEQALGRFVAAEQHLTESLSTHDAWVEQRRPALTTALGVIQSRLGWLEVSTNASEVELWLDGEPRPLSSSPYRVTAGSHQLVLRTPQGATTRGAVKLRGGERQVYRLEVTAAPSAPAPAALPSARRAPAPATASRRPVEASRGARTWAYATAAIAGAALGQAIAASLLRQGFVDDYNGPSCAPNRSERCAAYRTSANTFGTIALVGYAVAGAAGVTSITLFTEPWWNGASSSATVGVSGAF